jgi:L-aminopeptidase/D-esterase-like protein
MQARSSSFWATPFISVKAKVVEESKDLPIETDSDESPTETSAANMITTSNLVNIIAAEHKLTKANARRIVNTALDTITEVSCALLIYFII